MKGTTGTLIAFPGTPAVDTPHNLSTLEKYFIEELRTAYWSETHHGGELRKMAKGATNPDLKRALVEHARQTEAHVQVLESIFNLLGKKPQAKKGKAMKGIRKEVDEIIDDTPGDTSTRDVALISGAQKAEHYEIALYGCLTQIAFTIGREDISAMLKKILDENKAADERFTAIAREGVNTEALDD